MSASPIPRPAATLILARDGRRGVEVVMARRGHGGAFGGAHVFPGGAIEEVDRLSTAPVVGAPDEEQRPWMAAALRETAEEVGLFLTRPALDDPPLGCHGDVLYTEVSRRGARFDAARLVYVSNWVTPARAPRRFDTRFFLAGAGDLPDPVVLGEELLEPVWIRPADALERHRREEWPLVLPTIKHLELVDGFPSVGDLVSYLAGRAEVPTVTPRLSAPSGEVRVLLPGDPGYEEAG